MRKPFENTTYKNWSEIQTTIKVFMRWRELKRMASAWLDVVGG